MFVRGLKIPLILAAVVVALAAFAFVSAGDTRTADAVPIQPDCTFTPTMQELFVQALEGDPVSGNVTCTFSIHDEEHTLSVDFTVDLMGQPPISIDGCTLDSEPIHVGPCP